MDWDVLLLSLLLDLVAIVVLTYAIYFRRHHRRDLTLGFMGVNIGLFSVATYVSSRPVGLAFGIGLFALLSVIRLRSTQVTQEEIGYYFVAIVIGLVNGLSPDDHWGTTIVLTVVLVLVMYVADHPRVLPRRARRIVTLNKVYRDDFALRAALEKRLHGEITNTYVMNVDYARKLTQVDVRFRPHAFPKPPKPPKPPRARPEPVSTRGDAVPRSADDGTVGSIGDVAAAPVDRLPEPPEGPDAERPTPSGDGDPRESW
jgi:hypothetical protein